MSMTLQDDVAVAVSDLRKAGYRVDTQPGQVIVAVQAPQSETWEFLKPAHLISLADRMCPLRTRRFMQTPKSKKAG